MFVLPKRGGLVVQSEAGHILQLWLNPLLSHRAARVEEQSAVTEERGQGREHTTLLSAKKLNHFTKFQFYSCAMQCSLPGATEQSQPTAQPSVLQRRSSPGSSAQLCCNKDT